MSYPYRGFQKNLFGNHRKRKVYIVIFLLLIIKQMINQFYLILFTKSPLKNFASNQSLTGAEAILNLLKILDLLGVERQLCYEIFEIQEEIEDIESRIDFLAFEEKRLHYLILNGLEC